MDPPCSSLSSEESPEISDGSKLSEAQRDRMQRNREKAKATRQARLASAPYEPKKPTSSLTSRQNSYTSHRPVDSSPSSGSLRDTHGGFVLEEEEDIGQKHGYRLVEEDAPALPTEQETCEECGRRMAESFLLNKFDLSVCDQCRDRDGKHKLITKTEAKQRFLLKDGDFEERDGPALRYLLHRNPHGSTWGDMKLYLASQVQSRALSIWGGEEGLASERQRRGEARERRKEKKYAQEIKDLRRAMQFSRTPATSGSHEHSFPPLGETYNPDSDTWTKTCSECGYQVSFEKM